MANKCSLADIVDASEEEQGLAILSDSLRETGDAWMPVTEPVYGAVHCEIGSQLYASDETGRSEAYLSRWLKSRIKNSTTQVDLAPSHGLSDSQAEAARLVLRSPVAVLTGGPGTGKTYTCREIVRAYQRRGLFVQGCAFTGSAASRLGEQTGIQCQTIHSLLGYNGSEFTKDVSAQVLLIDEGSMITPGLQLSVCSRMINGARLIVVGDPDQLLGVEPGDVLQGLLSCVPSARLVEIRRTDADSPIGVASRQVLMGVRPDSIQGPSGKGGFVILQCEGLDRVSVSRWERNHPLTCARKFAEIDGVSVDDIRTMATSNACVEVLNRQFSSELGPYGIWMCLSNKRQLGIYNGDVGVCEWIDKRGVRIRFQDGLVRTLARSECGPARACTVNKMQGHEAHTAQMWVESASTRRAVYTAITRGKVRAALIGRFDNLDKAIARQERPRLSLLKPLYDGTAKFYDCNKGA